MKRLLFALCFVVAAVSPVLAQRGSTAFGVDIGASPCLEKGSNTTNFELDGKIQFGITNDIRLEGKLGYGFKDDHLSVFTIGINAHYLIDIVPKFKMYPIVGLGYGRPKVSYDDWSHSWNRFMFNVGVGGELRLTSNFSASLEFKYQYLDDFQRFPITVGFAYKF